ncbi:MAG: hypothetical protein ABSG31_05625 [Tepidisphaeraceae bacterium]
MAMKMDSETRFRRLLLAAAAALAILLISFYFDQRSDLTDTRDDKFRNLSDARNLLLEQSQLQQMLARWGGSLASDPTEAEGRLLHSMHDWEQQTSVKDSSFQRIMSTDVHGFELLTYEVSVEGNPGNIATLLYRIETAPIPLRVDGVQMRPKNNSPDLEMELKVSTLCCLPESSAQQNVSSTSSLAEGQP